MNSSTQHIYLSCDVPNNSSSMYQSTGISYKTNFSGGKGVLKKKKRQTKLFTMKNMINFPSQTNEHCKMSQIIH